MNTKEFTRAYKEPRNGCNVHIRHPGVRSFLYSDGVQECAEAGCYWLLDILATECPAAMRKAQELHCLVKVTVIAGKALIELTAHDDVPPIWCKRVPFTDMPTGEWTFELVDEGEAFVLILLTEH